MAADTHTIDIKETPLGVFACFSADAEKFDETRKCLEEIAAKCRISGKDAVLIEPTATGSMSNVYGFRFAGLLIDTFPTGMCIAIVDVDAGRRTHLEWGIRAQRVGSISIKVFATAGEAEVWLSTAAAEHACSASHSPSAR
jgi:hypothetical protein